MTDTTASYPAINNKNRQWRLFGYSIGDLGVNFYFQSVGILLMFFYTDIFQIPAYHVAGIMLIARIWDAINDPLVGYLADHTNSKWGRFRPWLLYAALPANLAFLACFFTPDLGETGKIIYAYVTYLTCSTLFTTVQIPFSSLCARVTQNQQERALIATYRMTFATVIAGLVVTILIPEFDTLMQTQGWTQQETYFAAASALAVCSTLLIWISFYFSREEVVSQPENYKLKDILPIAFKNDALVAISVAMFFNTGVWLTAAATAFYYFKYIALDSSLTSTYFAFMIIGNIIGLIISPFLIKKFGKLKMFMAGSLVVAGLGMMRFLVPGTEHTAIFVLTALFFIGQTFCAVTQWSMLPDTVEYGHWKNGIRSEGINSAFFSLAQKAGMAISGAIPALVLGYFGYVADADLSQATLGAIDFLFSATPAIYSILCLVALYFYRITPEFYETILADLKEGKGKQ